MSWKIMASSQFKHSQKQFKWDHNFLHGPLYCCPTIRTHVRYFWYFIIVSLLVPWMITSRAKRTCGCNLKISLSLLPCFTFASSLIFFNLPFKSRPVCSVTVGLLGPWNLRVYTDTGSYCWILKDRKMESTFYGQRHQHSSTAKWLLHLISKYISTKYLYQL